MRPIHALSQAYAEHDRLRADLIVLPAQRRIANLIAKHLGPAHGWCSINGTLVGALGWRDQARSRERDALLHGAGAFECAAMTYLRVRGKHAAALLSYLCARDLRGLSVERAAFAVVATRNGGVADELMVLRVEEQEFLLSAGACREIQGLSEARARFPSVRVEPAPQICLNLKGPRAMAAMGQLLDSSGRSRIAPLRAFDLCAVHTRAGAPVHVLRTKVGFELWGPCETLEWAWAQILARPRLYTPCGWHTLHRFRLGCEELLLPLYPLDIDEQTSLHASGHAWMLGSKDTREFIGREPLQRERAMNLGPRLVKLRASPATRVLPERGALVRDGEGRPCGRVTSSAHALRSSIPMAFAHVEGSTHSLSIDDTPWMVCHDSARAPASARKSGLLRPPRRRARTPAP